MQRSAADIYEEIGRRVLALKELHTLNFAKSTQSKNCKKGYPCGRSCINKNRNCSNPLKGQAKSFAAYLAAISGAPGSSGSTAPAPATPTTAPAPTTTPSSSGSAAIKTNQSELDKSRADLEQRYGGKTVEAAEKNVQRILDDADTNIYVRVGSAKTLELILGDRFKTAHELGKTDHDIPFLADDYLKARSRVESKALGYDQKGTADSDRPIYGYVGGKDLTGASHADTAKAYGSIAVKLKGDVKDRATFTAADSFKSGIASEIKNDGTPPPPNAASLVASTRHGYDVDKLPGHYPNYYNDKSIHGSQLQQASKAKTVDDLATIGAPTGNRYIEAQVHGKVTPRDIAEIAFTPTGVSDRPSAAIAQFAKDNGVPLLVNGKRLSSDELDAIITPPADRRSQTLQNLTKALDSDDFDAAMGHALQIADKAETLQLSGGERDRALKALYQESGYDGLPTVATSADIDKIYADGGLLMVRGVDKATSGDPNQYLKDFQSGDYFTGNGIYGNGTYVGHSGHFTPGGQFVFKNPKTAAKDAKTAVTHVERNGYISAKTVNFRMAADPKNFNVVTQSQLLKERDDLSQKLYKWSQPKRQQIIGNAKMITKADVTSFNKKLRTAQGKYDHAQTAVQVGSKKKANGGMSTTETQNWSVPTQTGKGTLDLTVEKRVSAYSSGATYIVKDKNGNAIASVQQATKTKPPTQATIKAIVDSVVERQTLEANGYTERPKAGEFNDPAVSKRVRDFDGQVGKLETILGLGDNEISNLAVIRQYDAVALDQSYEPTTFMNLLNRSKVVIQDQPLDWNRAKKLGAA